MAGSGFQEGFVQRFAWAFLISQEISWKRTMAGGAGFPSITRKGAGNLGYCHLSQVRVASNKNRTLIAFDILMATSFGSTEFE